MVSLVGRGSRPAWPVGQQTGRTRWPHVGQALIQRRHPPARRLGASGGRHLRATGAEPQVVKIHSSPAGQSSAAVDTRHRQTVPILDAAPDPIDQDLASSVLRRRSVKHHARPGKPHQHEHDGAERRHASRPAPSHRWSSWLLLGAARDPGRGRGKAVRVSQQAVHQWKNRYQAGGPKGSQIGSSDQAGEPPTASREPAARRSSGSNATVRTPASTRNTPISRP